MLTSIHLENYRSFADARASLSPLTLVVGANGAGKTNLLRAFTDSEHWIHQLLSKHTDRQSGRSLHRLTTHFNQPESEARIELGYGEGKIHKVNQRGSKLAASPGSIEMFRLDPDLIASKEVIVGKAFVSPNGSGTTQSLEALKNGDLEHLFDAAEKALMSYVPEIEKLSFITTETGKKEMQVRERGIKNPVPATQLSEGTRLIIALLAIVYQPVKPPVICLEDIDRGMHPRVFEEVVKLMQRLARENDVQIIATTHNPYLVDCFQEEPEAVVIVEKKDGNSTLVNLSDKLESLDSEGSTTAEMPLGNLWFSGFVGGVPDFLRHRAK